jgi:hypothetical protein
MWTDTHCAEINSFLSNQNEQLLLVYIDKQRGLTLCNTLPTYPVEQLTYFLRGEPTRVTKDNFLKVIQFGTVQGTYVSSLLRSMHDLYAPTFFENQAWPDSIHRIYVVCVL